MSLVVHLFLVKAVHDHCRPLAVHLLVHLANHHDYRYDPLANLDRARRFVHDPRLVPVLDRFAVFQSFLRFYHLVGSLDYYLKTHHYCPNCSTIGQIVVTDLFDLVY